MRIKLVVFGAVIINLYLHFLAHEVDIPLSLLDHL